MDGRFRLFGIPVEVSILFFVTVVLIRPRRSAGDAALVAAWVVVAFVSVLLHELGHALAGRAFGQHPRIRLFAMGGVTSWRAREPLSAWKRTVIAAAGPSVGIVLGAAAWATSVVSGLKRRDGPAAVVLEDFVFANFGWGVFNLLPMMPLDGGNIMAAVLEGLAGRHGRRLARVVSILFAVAVAVLLASAGAYVATALCALFVYANIQGLRAEFQAPATTRPETAAGPES
jgi:Zn-dependent protease